jgi:DNA-binding PadR family transcriptional regulator
MNGLTAFQRDILYVIEGMDTPHGLAIKKQLEAYYETEVNHGRLYPNLDDLAEDGLIEKGEYDKRTNKYTLSSEGRALLQARRKWEDEHLREAN